MNINFKTSTLGLLLAGALLTACSNDDSSTEEPTEPEVNLEAKYFIAAENDNGTYFLTEESLNSGTTTTTGNGIEDPNSYTHYSYNGNEAVMGLWYRQGNPAIGVMYGLDASGTLTEIGAGFQMTNGYSSVGPFENYIVATRGGITFDDGSVGQNFYFIDLDNNATVSSKQLTTLDLVGNGLECNLVGVVDAGDGSFLSAVEVQDGDVDMCYIVKLDANATVLNILEDDRIGQALGQWRSARYSLIANDDEGNTYVFGNPNGGTLKGGALKIPQGSTSFDSSYYFNIQDQADGYAFRKVYHVTGKYFLLEFYNEYEPGNGTAATQYGIVNVETQSFSWITGLPSTDNINDVGWPYASDDVVYIPITTADASPTDYVVDPVTASATAGIVVESATAIGGLAKLEYEPETTN